MVLIPIRVAGRWPLAAGVVGVWFAAERCFWFYALPSSSISGHCGICFLAMAGVPEELGLLGLIIAAMCLLRIPYFRGRAFDWILAAAGVGLTPFVLGVPLFAFAFLLLVAPILKAIREQMRMKQDGQLAAA